MILNNALITTTRSTFANGITSESNQSVLQQLPVHVAPLITPTTWETYQPPLPESALNSEFRIRADPDVDLRESDIVTNLSLLTGGPWPGTQGGNDTWRVVYVLPSTPIILPYINAYLERVRGGGPV